MSHVDLERPLEAAALREIERSLHGKLKAHRLSDAFIERCGEEALQKGMIEYFRAVKDGVAVENRDAFIVDAAFKRAIDELRREARRSEGTAVEALLESGGVAAPPTDEVAIDYLQAEELHEAMETLSPEDRQVLSLYYFEQRSAEDSAHVLHLSERSFRRRLKKTINALSEHLGVELPEQGSDLAIEIGLVAWVSLRGARVAVSQGPLEHLFGAVDSVRHSASSALEQIRDLLTRTTASGSSEKISALASGPVGKFTGGCLGTVALCALTGIIGPGVGGVDVIGGSNAGRPPAQHRVARRPTPPPPVKAQAPQPRPVERTPIPTSEQHAPQAAAPSEPTAAEKRTKEATKVVASQQPESAVTETTTSAPSGSSPSGSPSASPTEVAASQFGP